MNKVYRVIWSSANQCWMVVSELTASQKKQKSSVNKTKLGSVSTGITAMLLCSAGYAADYTSTITGDFTFPAGETSTITTTADSTPGINLWDETVTSNDDLVINTSGYGSNGIKGSYDSHVNLKNVTITTTGNSAFGIRSNGNFTSTGLVTVNTTNGSGGIQADNESNFQFADIDITNTGNNYTALNAYSSDSVISATGATTIHLIDGDAVTGVSTLRDTATVNLQDLTITGTNSSIRGIAAFPGTINVIGKTVIQADKSYSNGVIALLSGTVHLADAEITITGNNSHGLNAEDSGSSISSSGLTKVNITGNNSAGLRAQNGGVISMLNTDVTVAGDNSVGLLATGSSSNITSTGTTVIQTTGNNAYGLQAANGGALHAGTATTVNTTGAGATAVFASGAGSIIDLTAATTVATAGDGAHGLRQDGTASIRSNGGSITTSGAGSHGFTATGGTTKVFDGSAGNVLPTIVVRGAGSAMLDANGTGSQITLNNQTLDIRGAASANTWGIKSEAGGLVTINGGSTGGTGLWATGAGSRIALSGANAAGSRILLDTGAVLTTDPTGVMIGSLEGDASSAVNSSSAGGQLTLGSNNQTGNGSLIDEARFAGALNNISQLTKAGTLTQILSGTNNTVGNVNVTGGTLQFEQNGAFTTSGNYTTQAGATTKIGQGNSTLSVGGALTQAAGSTLNITLGSSPEIQADTASLGGQLVINGFADGPAPVKASEVTQNTYTVIHTTNGITGDFTNNPLVSTGIDYLLHDGHVSTNGKDYNLGFRMAWTEGLQSKGTGSFTVAQGTGFNIDTALTDQSGSFDSGWDGKSLTKAGGGLLVLSAVNTYSGKTIINDGTLRTDVADSIASSSDVIMNGGILDLNGHDQRFNKLAGTGGEVRLNSATVTLNNTTAADNTTFAGDIVDGEGKSNVIKTGEGSLTLTGKTGWTGDTHLDGGELVLDGAKGGAHLVSNIIAKDNTTFSLRNGASLTGSIDPTDVNIDKSSRWNMTADSLVDDISLAGTLNFVAPTSSPMVAGKTLTVTNWKGQNGTVIMNTVLNNDASISDKIVINGNTSGNTFVQVNNLGGKGAQTIEGFRLIEVKGLSDGTFTKSGRIVAGVYDYDIVKKGSDWSLTSHYSVRPESASYTSNLAAANTMFITRLHDRQGETQYIDPLTGEKKVTSLWLRQVGGHNRWKDSTGQLDTQSNRYVTQLGGDLAQWSPDGLQSWHFGAMAGYGNNESNSHSRVTGYHSEGSVSGYSAGLYVTWYENEQTKQGAYLDTWAQYGWFDNDVKGQNVQGESYDSSGITASLELGYTHKLGEFTGSKGSVNEWFIQPQAQAIWMGVTADDHRESNGTQVSALGEDNIQTRLGMRTFLKGHSKMDADKNRSFQPFVEANWIHNTHDFGTRMDEINVSQSGTRNIGEVKTGVEGQLNPHLNIWGNVGVQLGDKGYSDTSAMIGAKYSF